MSVLDAVKDLQNETAWQTSKINDRKPGGEMGKTDFLLLLSAQLRFQDPLNPQSDSDFAAGLAQFSSLEQMQNMNSSLEAMSQFQSFGLVGKYVIAETLIDGKLTEVPGVVDSIFTNNGVTYAQIGELVVPVSSIKEVFDSSNILTSEMLMEASKNLIGRTIVAQVDDKDIEGIVTRVLVDKGSMLAQIDDGTGEPKFVPVSSIVDIRETGTEKHTPKPDSPPDAKNFKPDGNGGFIELSEDGKYELGRWDWDAGAWEWVYTSFTDGEDAESQAA